MAVQLTDEQRDFVDALRDFAEKECGSREKLDALTDGGTEVHNQDIYKQMADLGWIGVAIGEEYGGSSGGVTDLCLLLEETSRGQIPIGGLGVTYIVAGAYQRFGTDAQKEAMLSQIAEGSVKAIAMSEPEAGSDVGNLKCKIERQNGSFVVNGHKTWITAAHLADHILLVGRTDASGDKHSGMTMIEVPTDVDGLEVSPIETMGGKEVNDVYFTDCELPAENVLGEVDKAWMQLMTGLNVERLIIAATMLGYAQRAFDDLLSYVSEREQFGRPVGSFQALSHRIADLATELEVARLLTYDVAREVDADPTRLFPREASMAKLKVTEVAKKMALEGMQMMGGYGYASEYDMERHVRTTLVSTIYGGTSEIQREIIAKTYGL